MTAKGRKGDLRRQGMNSQISSSIDGGTLRPTQVAMGSGNIRDSSLDNSLFVIDAQNKQSTVNRSDSDEEGGTGQRTSSRLIG